MNDERDHKAAVLLERPARLRRSWRRWLARLGVVACLGVAVIGGGSDLANDDRVRTCAGAVQGRLPGAVQVCQLEFQRTQDPMTGALWAEALMKDGDYDAARRVAGSLLATPARADAFYVLGYIARDEDRSDDATAALEEARMLHRGDHKPKQLARDDGVLAMAKVDRSEFAEALRLIDECITAAQQAGDTDLECYCHLAAAKALIRVGYWPAVDRELELAKPLAGNDERWSDLEYQHGSYAQESGHHLPAIAMFKKALQYRKSPPKISWTINTDLNLAYSLAETGQFDDARQHLVNATSLDSDHKKEPDRTWVAAQLAYRQHDLARAASLTEKYFEPLGHDDSIDPDDRDRDDRIDVAVLGAQIELERDDLKRAELWARRGVEQAERIRRTQAVLELRPWVLAKRRASYELLFTALARGQQIEEAAMVFDEWQGRTVQDALARPRPSASLDYGGMAAQVTRLGEWLRVASQAPFARSPDRQAVLRTMHEIDLLALIVANGEVWRLTANHGPPRLSKLGAWTEIRGLVDKFRGHPTDIQLASAMGALLLPDDAFRTTREVLHVLVDGQLRGLPVAALRNGAAPLITKRPIARVLRLPETRCVHVTRSGHATVLAAPGAKLPNALAEAEQVASLLHTTSKTGAAATKAALLAAKDDAVLHVAAHGTMGMDGAAIVLEGGEVSALEISALGVAPSLAVLSACDAATSDDPELAGSLAAGFLGAGSQHVVATLRSISDAGALEISTDFYRHGGVADPARALASVQSALAKTSNTDWPNVAVFGPDVCLEDAPDRP